MELEVKVSKASITDVIATSVSWLDEEVTEITLGNVLAMTLVDELKKDPRWGDLAGRFAAAADRWMDQAAPGIVQELVRAEVERQLSDMAQGAMSHGKPSTRAQAIVETEVTTQLRAQFAPLVDAALARVRDELDVVVRDAVAAAANRAGRGQR